MLFLQDSTDDLATGFFFLSLLLLFWARRLSLDKCRLSRKAAYAFIAWLRARSSSSSESCFFDAAEPLDNGTLLFPDTVVAFSHDPSVFAAPKSESTEALSCFKKRSLSSRSFCRSRNRAPAVAWALATSSAAFWLTLLGCKAICFCAFFMREKFNSGGRSACSPNRTVSLFRNSAGAPRSEGRNAPSCLA